MKTILTHIREQIQVQVQSCNNNIKYKKKKQKFASVECHGAFVKRTTSTRLLSVADNNDYTVILDVSGCPDLRTSMSIKLFLDQLFFWFLCTNMFLNKEIKFELYFNK